MFTNVTLWCEPPKTITHLKWNGHLNLVSDCTKWKSVIVLISNLAQPWVASVGPAWWPKSEYWLFMRALPHRISCFGPLLPINFNHLWQDLWVNPCMLWNFLSWNNFTRKIEFYYKIILCQETVNMQESSDRESMELEEQGYQALCSIIGD